MVSTVDILENTVKKLGELTEDGLVLTRLSKTHSTRGSGSQVQELSEEQKKWAWDDDTLPDKKGAEKHLKLTLNWVLRMVGTLVEEVKGLKMEVASLKTKEEEHKVREEEMVVKVEKVEVVEKKAESLETENDDLRQRSMKGNLIISSPSSATKASLFVRGKKDVQKNGVTVTRNETDVEMVTKLIKKKTGVQFEEREVEACHALGRSNQKEQEPTTWIIRINNLKPDSNFEILVAGMKTGRTVTSSSTTNFTDENVFLNHQITPKRSKFLKEEVKVAHRNKGIEKYLVDERGNIRVKRKKGGREDRGDRYKYYTVTNKKELNHIIDENFDYFKKNNTNNNY